MNKPTYEFNSTILERGKFYEGDWPQGVVKNEPMFFNASLEYAFKQGGPITRAFADNLPTDWLNCNPVLDSRVHMLMPGWFPCIPGYHHDDVPRGPKGQPDYDNPEYLSEHICALVNAEIAPTTFALGQHTLSRVPEGEIFYKHWHKEIEAQIDRGLLSTYECPSNTYIQFNWQSAHTGVRARLNGWRWFGRISRSTARQSSITNEIRRQVQVYLEFPMEGW